MSDSATGASSKGWSLVLAVAAIIVLCSGALIGSGGLPKTPDASNCLPTNSNSAPSGSVIFPLKEGTYTVSDTFGSRGGAHLGVDLAAPDGTPIYAATDGEVSAAGTASGFGHWVVVDSTVGGQKVSIVYGHEWAHGVLVKKGQKVKAGDHIANVGSDGESSGPHLHLEVVPGGRFNGGKQIDPMPWFAQAKSPTDANVQAAGQPSSSRSAGPTAAGTTTAQIALAAATGRTGGVGCGPKVGAGGLDVSKLLAEYPAAAEYIPWINKGAQACPDTPAPLIAAQLRNESGFQKGLVSPAQAMGPAQFLQGTWDQHAVDGDGDGKRDINNVADAVMSQAAYNCELMRIVKDGLASGKLTGDPVELMLSMYNCGPGGTLGAGQVCQNAETLAYVKEIPDTARRWSLPTPQPGAMLAGGFGQRAAAAARRWEGSPYVWGGGDANGPTGGLDGGEVGFDCSGLMIYAVAAASDGKIMLDHYTTRQLNDPRATPVAPDQLAAGDLVFPSGGDPQHVAMYVGNGEVVHAPTFGVPVKLSPIAEAVGSDFQARRFTA
ncbi:peptidoglycan DD-metalloendopeptidase family protein [Nocardia salmonicida]|uniref:peptidoglycan DD-metalloendopeptidase family protein n=1 Tax=Nocardia salmonicida TaxID=53431 RepID=UPI0007A4E4AF|nr:peptidoglycan DD-metalloendopeptidase family protein [Nocardia salmonicida]